MMNSRQKSYLVTAGIVFAMLLLLTAWSRSGQGMDLLTRPIRPPVENQTSEAIESEVTVSLEAPPMEQVAKESSSSVDRHSLPKQDGEGDAAARPSRPLPPPTPADSVAANDWLAEPSKQPMILVQYDSGDLASLINGNRGTLVAMSARSNALKRSSDEFLLAGPLNAETPRFIAASAANRWLPAFGIPVNPAGRHFSKLARTLPNYFGSKEFTVMFVPDASLAQRIMAEVSRAIRAVGMDHAQSNRGCVVEGELSIRRGTPLFTVQRVKDGENQFVVAGG